MTQTQAERAYLTELLKVLVRRFSFDELRMLCFELGIDDENLPDYAKSAFVRELLRHLDQQDHLSMLVRHLRHARPDITLPDPPRGRAVYETPWTAVKGEREPQKVWRRTWDHPLTAGLVSGRTQGYLPLRAEAERGRIQSTLLTFEAGTGAELWQRTFKDVEIAGLAQLRDGGIALSLSSAPHDLEEGGLVALGPTGDIRWRSPLDARSLSAPASHAKILWVTVDGDRLLGLETRTGQVTRTLGIDVALGPSAPAVDGDTAYLPCEAPVLIAASLRGEIRWRFGVPGALSGVWLDQTPWIGPRIVVTVARQGTIFGIERAGGTPVWESEVGPRGAALTTPVGDAQRIYVGARDGVHALYLEGGRPAWTFPTPSPVEAAPVLSGGVLCLVTQKGRYYGLDPRSGRILWHGVLSHGCDLSPVLVEGDARGPYALFGNREGALTAITYPVSAEDHQSAGRWLRAAQAWEVEGELRKAASAWEAQARSLAQRRDAGPDVAHPATAEQIAAWEAAEFRYREVGDDEKAEACQRNRAALQSLPVLSVELEHPPMARQAWSQLRLIIRNLGFGVARDVAVSVTGGPFEGEVLQPQRLSAIPPDTARIRTLDVKPLEYGERVPLRLRIAYTHSDEIRHEREETIHIPVAQRENAGRAGLIALSAPTHVDMEVRIDPSRDGYQVELTVGDGRVFSGGALSEEILDWRPGGDALADGRHLFSSLFSHAGVRRGWDAARGSRLPCRVRLRISPDAPELHLIPWELMNDGERVIAADAQTPFSRYVPVSKPWGSKVDTRPVRVLGLIANPGNLLTTYNLTPLNVRLERYLLARSFSAIDPSMLRLEFMRPPVTLERLGQAVQRGYHLVHVVAHSRFNTRRSRTELLLEDASGRARPVTAEALSQQLAHQAVRPHLVFLSICRSGPDRLYPSMLGMGRDLVQAGVPAVVAMQGAIRIKTAQMLTERFYACLAEDGVVDRALNHARNALLSHELPDAEKPVLFMRLPSGRLW